MTGDGGHELRHLVCAEPVQGDALYAIEAAQVGQHGCQRVVLAEL